jgi:hypothetical protein
MKKFFSKFRKALHPETPAGLKTHLRDLWHNRMDSPMKKMTCGAMQISTIIKSRFKWGEKSFRRNLKNHKK